MHFVGITLKGLVGSRLPVKKTPFQRRCKFAPPCYQPCCLFAGYLDRALTAAGRAGGEAVFRNMAYAYAGFSEKLVILQLGYEKQYEYKITIFSWFRL